MKRSLGPCLFAEVSCGILAGCGGLTIGCQRLEGSRRTKGARVGDAHHGDQDHGVEDGWECFDACEFDSNDERRATTFSAGGVEQRAVGWYDEADEEEIDNVEDANTPDDLLGGLWDFLLGICGLGRSQSSKFGSAEGKRGRDKDGTESLEAIEETTGTVWLMPNTSPWSAQVENLRPDILTSMRHQCNLWDRWVHRHSQ
jgi:hypothetical protein